MPPPRPPPPPPSGFASVRAWLAYNRPAGHLRSSYSHAGVLLGLGLGGQDLLLHLLRLAEQIAEIGL